jgi:hypothetical protein
LKEREKNLFSLSLLAPPQKLHQTFFSFYSPTNQAKSESPRGQEKEEKENPPFFPDRGRKEESEALSFFFFFPLDLLSLLALPLPPPAHLTRCLSILPFSPSTATRLTLPRVDGQIKHRRGTE